MIARRSALAALLAAPSLARGQPARAPGRGSDLAPMPLPVKQDDSIARGYRRDALVRWGDRVTFDAPPWAPLRPDPEGAAAQFGWDARLAGVAAPTQQAADGIPRAVLAVVHPTVQPGFAFPGGRDQPAAAAMMQGASLLNLERRGRWVVVDGGFQSRRLTAATLCRLSGPFGQGPGGQGSVRGVLGLQGGCVTPWGTLLLAEGDPAPWLARLGADPAQMPPAGYGWVVELNPFDPQSLPVKRTALGRFAHGDVAATLSRDGHAVVYLTDRRAGGFLFRFVSAGTATAEDALDAGRLSVARMEGERVTWMPLPAGSDPVAAAGPAGGSPLDMPAGLGLDPSGPRLLLACHGGPSRPAGHVIELTASGGDDGAEGARAALLFAAGDPRGPETRYGQAGLPPGSAWLENPATVTVDGRGRAWIGTDRGGRVGAQADGLFGCDLDGPRRGVPLPLYGAPRAGAIGGAALTPDGEVLFSAVRHPGAEPGTSFERPATRWPEFQAGLPPRSTLIGLVRNGGGPVGG
ncbi:PhoX family protein [Roseicella frigidaeris]|nr:alkaline phosphatase PhoX [Roseicella frigidaeris]